MQPVHIGTGCIFLSFLILIYSSLLVIFQLSEKKFQIHLLSNMKKFIIQFLFLTIISLLISSCSPVNTKIPFIQVDNGKLIRNNQPYFFIGANYWYGVNIAADTVGGDRTRLIKELDFMKSYGIDNLRLLVGAEGPDNQPFRATPTLIKSPGVYSPKLLEGLDFILNELHKRNMVAVLYLTNNWEWSGGMAQYLNWNGYGEFPNPNLPEYTWNDFFAYQKQFYSCEPCINQVNQYIEKIITRTNSISGIKYSDDPTIMAWELANEPRPMADDNFEPFTRWIIQTAKLIKTLDHNHLVTTGNEGQKGCSESLSLFKTINQMPEIDYITIHIWMKNWSWYNYQFPDSTLPLALEKVSQYFDNHLAIADELNKPVVLEEFGIARDYENFMPGTPVKYRDSYYSFIFNRIEQSLKSGDNLVGCNFWAFGGYGFPVEGNKYWKPGNPYTGDPAQEEQGLNSVFASDTSTLNIIKKYNQEFTQSRTN